MILAARLRELAWEFKPPRLAAGAGVIGAGQSMTCIAMADGSLVCGGANNAGQLGVRYSPTTYLPIVVPGFDNGDVIPDNSLKDSHTFVY